MFPLAAGVGARLAARARGVTGMLAFTQVARSAGGPMRVALLLALGVGMACFALLFSASLAQNGADRAAYATGADVRITEAQALTGGDAANARAALLKLPGVTGITPIFRGAARGSSDINAPPAGLLAVDPATWAGVAGVVSWRTDYAATSPGTLMAQLRAHQWPAPAAGATPVALGDADHPIWALVSDSLAANLHLRVGQRFTLRVANTNADETTFVMGALVHAFPTLYPGQVPGGFVVVALDDAQGVRASPMMSTNQWWVRTAGNLAFAAALARAAPNLSITQTLDRRQIQAQIAASPLLAGMRGLLAVGVTLTVALALLGSMMQAALSARGRMVQFAVLRSLGMRGQQLRRMLLGEQAVVYLFGLVAGTLFGVGMAFATLPYLQFGDAVLDPTTIGVPPERLVVDPITLIICYGALVLGFVFGLLVTASAARRMGLGQTLRLGED